MDRLQRRVEILIHLLKCHADMAAGRQAPVVRLEPAAVEEFHDSLDNAQFGRGQTILQPADLVGETPRPLNRFGHTNPSLRDSAARVIVLLSDRVP